MNLGDKQRLFTKLTGLLISWCYTHGYELTYGEAYRSDEQAEINALGSGGRAALAQYLREGTLWKLFSALADKISNNTGSGIRRTLHEDRLAVDFNVFKNGRYLTETIDLTPIGEFWESLHPLARWGGRFRDGNHFSIEHEGRK